MLGVGCWRSAGEERRAGDASCVACGLWAWRHGACHGPSVVHGVGGPAWQPAMQPQLPISPSSSQRAALNRRHPIRIRVICYGDHKASRSRLRTPLARCCLLSSSVGNQSAMQRQRLLGAHHLPPGWNPGWSSLRSTPVLLHRGTYLLPLWEYDLSWRRARTNVEILCFVPLSRALTRGGNHRRHETNRATGMWHPSLT